MSVQDSMGKDGTQLLRHCVRLLLVVATDLLSIRQSGTVMTFCRLFATNLVRCGGIQCR